MQALRILLCLLSIFGLACAKTRKYELNVMRTMLNPDCFNQSYSSLTINGQLPAPTLYAVRGDSVEITVKNESPDSPISIHFHGIRQVGSPFADGVANITQLAVPPGQSFVQKFTIVDQSGTFYYHAHVAFHDDTVQGPFIIYESEDSLKKVINSDTDERIKEGPYIYDGEIVLQWGEWWHQTNDDRYAYTMGPTYAAPPAPDSFLINGKSVFSNNSAISSNNQSAKMDSGDSCRGFEIFNVERNKTYRLRFIGALTFRILGVLIPEHQMTLIEIDGEYTQPYNLSYVEFAAGQRMSVLIHTGDYPDGTIFPIASNNRRLVIGTEGYTANGYGYLQYGKSQNQKMLTPPDIATLPQDVFPAVDVPGWILKDVKPYYPSEEHVLRSKPYQTIKISMDEVFIGNLTRFSANGRVWTPWGTPTMSVLDTVLANPINIASLESDGYSKEHNTYYVPYGKVIDLVFQNAPTTGGFCVDHPWHTHGHSHYLIAEGPGEYDMEQHADVITFKYPLKKDVSMLYPIAVNNTVGCGWTKVRIFTNNPGIWAVHCHITMHMVQGKMIVLE
ncbi:multicopper oxidase, partial [Backusella circina FSU 941]